ncbi:hypothetical protein TWF718_005324 [Orbilia javanica]|uniref:Uncharacterized protein n=1 Tax=Orbilia javanica TaxID=47235 RepID=A0AAN8RJB3_9PEZI
MGIAAILHIRLKQAQVLNQVPTLSYRKLNLSTKRQFTKQSTMVSVLDPYVQDYTPLRQYPPMIPQPERATRPAAFCIRSILANRQRVRGAEDKMFVWPAQCDMGLMKEAVSHVPQVMDKYFAWWVDRVGVDIVLPEWYPWYQSMLTDLHRHRHWHNEHPIRWEFAEVAAALDPKYDDLRRKSPWVWRPEMKQCVKSLRDFLAEPKNLNETFRYSCNDEKPKGAVVEGDENGKATFKYVALCIRSPQDESVVEYTEEWEFEWGEHTCYKTDYWGEEKRSLDLRFLYSWTPYPFPIEKPQDALGDTRE